MVQLAYDFAAQGNGMISHAHFCIFAHVPKTGGKAVRSLFGLPEFEKDYVPSDDDIEDGFGHRPLRDLADRKYFSHYFKFAFVRNPFDRLVSAFFYLEGGGCNDADRAFRQAHLAAYGGSFHAFVEGIGSVIDTVHFRPQTHWLCAADGRVLSDFIGRYEDLERDTRIVTETLGLGETRPLPVMNTSNHMPYQAYFDESTRRRVATAYGDDLETFAYRFE